MGIRRGFGPLLLAASLCSVSCWRDKSGTDTDVADPAGRQVTAVTDQAVATSTMLDPTSTTVSEPADWAAWEAQGRAQREAIVKRIKDNKWGVGADNILRGPEGWTVDLNHCPAGWSQIEGLTDSSIKVGHTAAYSGTLAEQGNIGRAMANYFRYVGAITDSEGRTRTIDFMERDDGYDPARTIPLVDEFLDREQVFALSTVGSVTVLKTYDKVNARCVPQIALTGAHQAFGDPQFHPWTAGLQLAYTTEAMMWGRHIEQTLPKGATVAASVFLNDFGNGYLAGFQAFLAQSNHAISFRYGTFDVMTEFYSLNDLLASTPDVFIFMGAGVSCTQHIVEVWQMGLQDAIKQRWLPSVCEGSNFVGRERVGGDGSASDGWLMVGGGMIDFTDPANQSLPQVRFATEQLQKDNYDVAASSYFGNGYVSAYPIVEYLRVASALDGGLTRANLMLAIRSMDFTSPFMRAGIRLNMNGLKDAYMVEGSEVGRYNASTQRFEQIAAPVDLSGRTPNCVWV